jgi:cell division protein FtsN
MTPRPSIEEPTVATAEPQPPPAALAPAADADAPVDLLNSASAEGATPPPAPIASSEGNFVQLSSQRSMEQAQSAYADLQSRYASVLGSLSPQIQEADLGAKGIYFRVRVGPWATRAEAIAVCESLKSAGGDCIVIR